MAVAKQKGFTPGEVSFLKALQESAARGESIEQVAERLTMEVNSIRSKLSGMAKRYKDGTGRPLPIPSIQGINSSGRRGARVNRLGFDDVTEQLGLVADNDSDDNPTDAKVPAKS